MTHLQFPTVLDQLKYGLATRLIYFCSIASGYSESFCLHPLKKVLLTYDSASSHCILSTDKCDDMALPICCKYKPLHYVERVGEMNLCCSLQVCKRQAKNSNIVHGVSSTNKNAYLEYSLRCVQFLRFCNDIF